MIEISSYKQAYQFHQSNRIPLVILQDIAFMLMNACQDIPPNVSTCSDINHDNLKWLSGQLAAEFNFNEYLGGSAFICESESELSCIKAFDQDWANDYGEWPNVTNKPIVWDVFYILNDDWAVFAYLWNNAGGDIYYVPKSLWQQARVDEHRQLN